MKSISFKQIISVIAAGVGLSVQAQSTLITFEDLGDVGIYGTAINNGYSGLDWNNFYSLNGSAQPNGYLNGFVSPANLAFNGFGDPADITSASAFTLGSGFFTAAWLNSLDLEVQGYNGGSLVYDNHYVLNTTGPQYLVFNFSGITDARFTTSGGVDAGFGGSGTQFALDNLTIGNVAPVPEPSILALAGLGGLALLLRQRRKQVNFSE